jgi:hypothetical protein
MLARHAALVAAVKDAPSRAPRRATGAGPVTTGGPGWGAGTPLPADRRPVPTRPRYPGDGGVLAHQGHHGGICRGRRCVSARTPCTARTRQLRPAGAIRAAGPGLPWRLPACGTDLAGRWLPVEGRAAVSGPGRPPHYEMRVDGVLDDRWADWFGGLQATSDGTQTVISGLPPRSARPARAAGQDL